MATLSDLTSPEVRAISTGTTLAIPLGSTEQHGPHLPLSTDTDLAVELCRRLAARRDDVVVAPPLSYGASGEHAGFAGTLSMGTAALEVVLVELVRSATETFDHVLIVSGHGGNNEALVAARDRLVAESRDVRVFTPRWDGDPHAGRQETAMMLALSPDRVRADLIATGDERPLAEIWQLLRDGGVVAVTSTGVLGNPVGATSEVGEALLDALTTDLVTTVAQWRGHLAEALR